MSGNGLDVAEVEAVEAEMGVLIGSGADFVAVASLRSWRRSLSRALGREGDPAPLVVPGRRMGKGATVEAAVAQAKAAGLNVFFCTFPREEGSGDE